MYFIEHPASLQTHCVNIRYEQRNNKIITLSIEN